jgi:predicted flap endonuclease-1-like 5' DNA nuclease
MSWKFVLQSKQGIFSTQFIMQLPKVRGGIMAKLSYVEGIGDVYAAKLKAVGVGSTDSLLKAGSTSKGRKELAEAAGVSDKLILEWVNHVDLFRIKGVGQEYADLLEEAGVDTVPELAQRNPENLYAKLVEVNQQKKLVRVLPSTVKVRSWVTQAKGMPRVIKY